MRKGTINDAPLRTYRTSAARLGVPAALRTIAVAMVALGAAAMGDGTGEAPWIPVAAIGGLAAYAVLEGSAYAVRRARMRVDVHRTRIVHRVGIVARHVSTAYIAEIIGQDVDQSQWGRLLGYGSMRIDTRGVDRIVIEDVGEIASLEDIMRQLRDGAPPRR